ncbi:MAG: glycosyltransferase family 4 protein [Leptolyngbyaceae cyanobacterium SL_7_1]|nr:glycosyltransferase family 4 protein [Leptolyngbyaceae cyanobacterium SL_7_1]
MFPKPAFPHSPPHRILVAQLGAQQHYSIPIALHQLGWLQQFYTDFYWSPLEVRCLQELCQFKAMGAKVQFGLSRHNSQLDFDRVTRFNWLGVRYRQALHHATARLYEYWAHLHYGRRFGQAIERQGLPDATHLYAFDHGALALFEAAKSRSIACILDQRYPAFQEEGLEWQEERRWQGWAIDPCTQFYRSPLFQQWSEVQRAEWQLADRIVVPSSYTHRSMVAIAPTLQFKLHIVTPMGNVDAYRLLQQVRQYRGDRPLRVLFVGRVNLRNGIPDLLTAFQRIDPCWASLTIAGRLCLQPERLQPFQNRVTFLGSVPSIHLPQLYRSADVLILPTISDGFGTVISEAMATGLPVIATDHCGDLVQHGVNGWRIPIRQPDAIAYAIRYLHHHPDLLVHLSHGAIATSQTQTLQNYQTHLAQLLPQP